MSRHLFDRSPRDSQGIAVPNVTVKAYPWTLGQTFVSQAASGEWSFDSALAPAEAAIYATADEADTSVVLNNQLTSFADGSVVEAYLDAGTYTIVASVAVGALIRYDVHAKYEVGVGGATDLTAIEARMTAVEAREDAGEIIGTGATIAELETARDASADASANDRYFLTADENGTGTADAPQYPIGEYVQLSDGSISLLKPDAVIDDEVIQGSGAPTGAVPTGAKTYTDTDTGQDYIVDPANPTAWIVKPTPVQTADPSTMTFSI